MGGSAGGKGLGLEGWEVTVLPLPKRFSRGAALGFCGGHAVGRAEDARAKCVACWWPDGRPELLALEGQKALVAGRAAGAWIPGHWEKGGSGAMGAVAWRFAGGSLAAANLHEKAYEKTWATGAGGDVVVGVGSPPGKLGHRAPPVGLVWREGAKPAVVAGPAEVALSATDGTRVAGSLDGRAALWPSVGAAPVDLAPASMPASEVQGLDGETQVGIAWKGMCARAGLWRGTAASFRDLTPKGFETARAYAGAQGLQVGFVRAKDTTRNGSTGADNRAALWRGEAEGWFDLNALLPAKDYNASVAWAVEVRGDAVRICGEASRYEARDPGTPGESHFVPAAHPVLWTARLRSGSGR